MPLKHQYDSMDDVPEQFRELFSEKGGKVELTGVTGIKTQADVDRVKTALDNERTEHKTTKATLAKLGGRDVDDVLADLGRLTELETAAGGKLDDEKINALVEERIKNRLARHTNPLQKQIDEAQAKIKEQESKLAEYHKGEIQRKMHKTLLDVMGEPDLGVRPEHHEDVFLFAERELGFDEHSGELVVRDGHKDAGLSAKDWLAHRLSAKPAWRPESSGTGSRGSGKHTPGVGSDNPWSKDGWNMTKQAQLLKGQGVEVAERMARAAGSKVGAVAPPE